MVTMGNRDSKFQDFVVIKTKIDTLSEMQFFKVNDTVYGPGNYVYMSFFNTPIIKSSGSCGIYIDGVEMDTSIVIGSPTSYKYLQNVGVLECNYKWNSVYGSFIKEYKLMSFKKTRQEELNV